jgi:transcriptional regulator with XRE-family HTH domain
MHGQRIRQLRESLGYTQDDLAEKISVAVLQINRYENNKTKPNGDIVARLARVLHTSTDYLLGLTDDFSPTSLNSNELTAKERAVIGAWRRGQRFEAIKVIVDDE